jgi:hypothetical protein
MINFRHTEFSVKFQMTVLFRNVVLIEMITLSCTKNLAKSVIAKMKIMVIFVWRDKE